MFRLFIALSLVVIPSLSFAWEHPKNPDRFPSLGLTYAANALEGDFASAGTSQDIESESSELLIDTRLPLSDSFTLSVGLGGVSTNTKGKDSPTLFSSETDASGGSFVISGRWYFNR